jgi:hypothetical protein
MVCQLNLPATYTEVFKKGISVAAIVMCGLEVLSTNHSLIPKLDGNLKIKRF